VNTDDEILDLVDERGLVVGQARRGDCHGDPRLLHQAVHVLVFAPDGALFLQRRARTKRIQPGRWDSSVGGHVDHGEHHLNAARREMAEELGLDDPELPLTFQHQYIWRSGVESEYVRTFRCSHPGPFTLHPDEIEEGRFFTAEELRALPGTGEATPNLEHELELLGLLTSRSRSEEGLVD
jgi:isopentenyl-diphosphate delta-isomerase type 1